jgi:hypothetical protein
MKRLDRTGYSITILFYSCACMYSTYITKSLTDIPSKLKFLLAHLL